MEDYIPMEAKNFYYGNRGVVSLEPEVAPPPQMTPEIVEIEEDIRSISTVTSSNRNLSSNVNDVYVAVGKDDLDVLQWALDHVVSTGSRVLLIHVFPPITFIPTPVGRISKSQLSSEQVQGYINEENNKRRNLLQKYIKLCNDAEVLQVNVDTVLLESNVTSKAILDAIPVLNITNLVIGIKTPPSSSRLLRKQMAIGEAVKKSASDACEVNLVRVTEDSYHSKRNFFQCACFQGKSNSLSNQTNKS